MTPDFWWGVLVGAGIMFAACKETLDRQAAAIAHLQRMVAERDGSLTQADVDRIVEKGRQDGEYEAIEDEADALEDPVEDDWDPAWGERPWTPESRGRA